MIPGDVAGRLLADSRTDAEAQQRLRHIVVKAQTCEPRTDALQGRDDLLQRLPVECKALQLAIKARSPSSRPRSKRTF
ncbi:MAG: hypothetical protein ACUVX9_16385 [Anaerolineae bacterium]